MASPFPPSSSRPGDGHVVANLLPGGGSCVESVSFQYPLKLITPKAARHHRSALVWILSYGGGLVGGDQVNVSVDVQPQAKLSIITQGHTKVFKSARSDIVTRQSLDVKVGDGAAICLLPDPVQPFADSVYEQVQIFKVAETASVCLLDWVTQGRTARGEDWSFSSWKGRNEIWQVGDGDGAKDRLLVRDTVKLAGDDPLLQGAPLRDTMHENGVFGTLILRGHQLTAVGDFFLAEFAALPRLGARGFRTSGTSGSEKSALSDLESWRARRLLVEREQKVLWTTASIRGCTIVKFSAATVEGGRTWLNSMLVREASLLRIFGEEALHCMRH